MSLSFSWSSLSFCPGPAGPAGPDGSSYEVTTRGQVDASLTQIIVLENLGASKYNIVHNSGHQFFIPNGQSMEPEEDGMYIFQSNPPDTPQSITINMSDDGGSSLTTTTGNSFLSTAQYYVGTTAHITIQSANTTVEFLVPDPPGPSQIALFIKPLLTFSSV